MTDNNAISLPESSALRPQGWKAEVEVISTDLTEEQRALVIQVKQLSAVVHMAGLERAKRLRLLRETFPKVPPGAQTDPNARPGWREFLRREFDTNVKDVGLEISAIEAGEAKLEELEGGPALSPILQEIGSSHLNEIGRGATPAIRRKVWDKLFDGSLNLNKRAIRAEVKLLNQGSTRLGLKVPPPPKPPSTINSPPRPDPKAKGASAMSRSKYGNLPERDKELNYLKGKHTANDKLADDLTTLMRASATSGSGKIARLQVLAAALHREFKSIGDRYHHSWDLDRHYPSYMTLWQHIWTEEETFNLHAELEAVRKDIAEANRYFSIANMHIYKEGLEVTE